MIKRLPVILLISLCSLTYGQTIKTDVLVVGGSTSGIAAAIQCARSKVKTILAAQGQTLGSFKGNGILTINANHNIPSGTWGEFRKHIRAAYKKTPGFDTSYNAVLRFSADTAVSILKKMADTTKNLSTYLDARFITIKKDGDKWEATIIQNEKVTKIIARVIIDATENGEVAIKAGAKLPAAFNMPENHSNPTAYRTSIATGISLQQNNNANQAQNNYPPYPIWYIPMNAVVLNDLDNVLLTEKVLPANKGIENAPLEFELGQGAGTVAAYCAFFKTTTKNLKVRIIQGELLDFKGYLLPFTDISQTDNDWRAIQQICATGLLKGILYTSGNDTEFLFKPDSLVNTAEIQPVLTEIYTRAFLWFSKEKPGEKFTLGNLLSFISDYTLTDPQVLKYRIQKDWKTYYKFKTEFVPNHPVTRREFAVLANKFLNPFARTVDLNGQLVN
jgi:hypothetical protein